MGWLLKICYTEGSHTLPVIMVCHTEGSPYHGKTVSHTVGPHFHEEDPHISGEMRILVIWVPGSYFAGNMGTQTPHFRGTYFHMTLASWDICAIPGLQELYRMSTFNGLNWFRLSFTASFILIGLTVVYRKAVVAILCYVGKPVTI